MRTEHYWSERNLKAVRNIPNRNTKHGVLVMIHGMWGGKHIWKKFIEIACADGYNSIAVDLFGHHESLKSTSDLGNVSVNNHITDVCNLVNDIDTPIIIGHSMGGLIAQVVVSRMKNVVGGIFMASAPPYGISMLSLNLIRRMLHPRYINALLLNKAFMPREIDAKEMLFNSLSTHDSAEEYKSLMEDSGRAARELAFGLIKVEKINQPTLVVSPVDDKLILPKVQKKIAEFHGSSLMEVSGDHMFLTSNSSSQCFRGIFQWLNNFSD